MMVSIDHILRRQLEFQRLVNIPIDEESMETKLHLAENYLFKAVEEIVELRKTMPSSFNKYEKNPSTAEQIQMLKELSDVLLFLINFCLVWNFSIKDIMNTIDLVQMNNFKKLAEKIEGQINDQIRTEEQSDRPVI